MCKSIEVIEFRNAIKNYVTESPLPEEVKRMVLSQLLDEQAQRTLETVKKEIADRDKEVNADAESVSEN